MAVAHQEHTGFEIVGTAKRARMGAPRAIAKRLIARQSPLQPFVARIGMYLEAPAQLPPVFHDRHLAPWHGPPPSKPILPSLMCRLCPRTPVEYVPGLNIKPGHDE